MTSAVVGLVDKMKMITTMSGLVEKQLPSLVEAHTTQYVSTAVRPLISQVQTALGDLAKAGGATVQQQHTVHKALTALQRAAVATPAGVTAPAPAPTAPALKPAIKPPPPDPANFLGALQTAQPAAQPATPPGTQVVKKTRFGPSVSPTPSGFTVASVASAMPAAPAPLAPVPAPPTSLRLYGPPAWLAGVQVGAKLKDVKIPAGSLATDVGIKAAFVALFLLMQGLDPDTGDGALCVRHHLREGLQQEGVGESLLRL